MKINFSIELKAVGKALLFSLFLCFLSAVIIYYSSLSEAILPTLGKTILAITVFMAACLAARSRGSKGLVLGLNMGLVIFILLFIITLAFQPSALAIRPFLYSLCLCLIAGAIGGVIGIGLHK